MQRFYAHIEVGPSPFSAGGPHNFNADVPYKACKNIVIKNGKLGLTSHHGIHGNLPSNVLINNLEIFDFEVGGIHLNGASNVEVKNCVIGPSTQGDKGVPVRGTFSAATFIKGYVKALADEGSICDGTPAFLTVRG